jgi:hypothetical protein
VHYDGVTFTDELKQGFKLRALGVLSAGLIGEHAIKPEALQLADSVLI